MTKDCIPLEALGTLDALPPDHPMRRHAATCPRCSSLLFAYESFVRADAVQGADAPEAERRLDAFITRRVQGGEPEPAPVARAPKRGRGRWFELPAFRFAAAAVALVLIATVVARWQPWAPERIVYRGEGDAAIEVEPAQLLADGAFELRWTAVPGADSYRVTILGADLSELARLPLPNQVGARFDPKSLAAGQTAAYWRVEALREGGVIASSAPEPLS
jgi:hypothetical protein